MTLAHLVVANARRSRTRLALTVAGVAVAGAGFGLLRPALGAYHPGVDAAPFLSLFPEYQMTPEERAAWLADRMGAIVGEKLANKYGWRAGDRVSLRGTLFPGDWSFTIRGVYRPRDASTIATQMLLHE